MAIPFLAGLALGATAVVAFNNKKDLKKVACSGLEKTKKISQEVTKDLKKTASDTVDFVKDKISPKENKKVSPKTKTVNKKPRTKTVKKITPKETDEK